MGFGQAQGAGGGGTFSGSLTATDNTIAKADGTGGVTFQGAASTLSDTEVLNLKHASGALQVNSTQVVSAQGGPVDDPVGGATEDNECRNSLATLLGILRTHGLIAAP